MREGAASVSAGRQRDDIKRGCSTFPLCHFDPDVAVRVDPRLELRSLSTTVAPPTSRLNLFALALSLEAQNLAASGSCA